MNLKHFILTKLTTKKEYLENQTKHLTPNKQLVQPIRIKDLVEIIKNIKGLKFEMIDPVSNPEIGECLSPYGTFCDKRTFYYYPEVLLQHENDLLIICMSEYFNSCQEYLIKKEITNLEQERYKGDILVALYHIGVIKEKIIYANTQRNKLFKWYEKRYRKECDYKVFAPNMNAASYLLNQVVLDLNDKLYFEIERNETNNILNLKGKFNRLYPTENSGLYGTTQSYDMYFIKEGDDNYKRVTKASKIIKENLEYIEMANKLRGIC